MPTALSDPSRTFYILLAVIVVILGAVALRRQKKADVISFAIAAAVLLLVFLVDRAVDSPREEVDHVVAAMASAGQTANYDAVFQHVSDSFSYKGKNKQAARQAAETSRTYFPEGIRIWGVTPAGFKHLDDTTAEQEFDAQFVNGPQTRHRCIGVFKKENGVWKMTTFRLYPVVGTADPNQEATIPGL
jgi:hypothetical protein